MISIDFQRRAFDELSAIRYSIEIGQFHDLSSSRDILKLSYFGVFDRGTKDSVFVGGITAFAEWAWSPYAIILDLREFTYTWGDDLRPMFGSDCIPKYVVVSDNCRDAIKSFIDEEMFDDSSKWLYDSFGAALEECHSQLAAHIKDWETLKDDDEGLVERLVSSFPKLKDDPRNVEICKRLIDWAQHHRLREVRTKVSSLKLILKALESINGSTRGT